MIALLSLLTALTAHATLEARFREAGNAAEKCARETPGPACYDLAAQTVKAYIDSRPPSKKMYGDEERNFDAPRAWLTGHATDKVYLLVHSYTLSPAELDGFAAALIPKGVNVFSVLLEGHGSRSSLGGGPFSLADVSREDWKADTHFGVQLARALGKKVLIVSYSLGGLLAVLEGSDEKPMIDGFLAVAPPIAINDKLWGGPGACTLQPLLRNGLDDQIGGHLGKTVWRKAYLSQYVEGACELLNLVTDFNHTGRSAGVINNAFRFESTFPGERHFANIQRADFARLKVPYVLIASPHDNAVDYATLERLTKLSAAPGTLFTSNAPDHIHYGMARPDSSERAMFLEALEKLDEITGK